MIYALLALVAAVIAYFLFFRKSEPAQLAPRPTEEQPPPGAKRNAPAASAEADEDIAPASGVAPARSSGRTRAAEPSPPPRPPSTSQPPPSPSRPPPPSARAPERAPRDIGGLRRGVPKARGSEGFFGRLRALFSGKKELNPEIASELEEVLLSSDVGS